jgi:hypothetical protein
LLYSLHRLNLGKYRNTFIFTRYCILDLRVCIVLYLYFSTFKLKFFFTQCSRCVLPMYLCKIYIVHVCEIFIEDKPFLTELIDHSTYMHINETHWIFFYCFYHLSIFFYLSTNCHHYNCRHMLIALMTFISEDSYTSLTYHVGTSLNRMFPGTN